MCAEESIAQSCNCSSKLGEFYTNCYINGTDIMRKCIDSYTNKIISDKEFFIKYCLDRCPVECDYIIYKTNTNYVQFSDKVLDYYKLMYPQYGNMTNEMLGKNVVYLNVNYANLQYTFINQIPTSDLISLISNIGGTLGLFLGISFFSLVEILEIFMEIAYILKQ